MLTLKLYEIKNHDGKDITDTKEKIEGLYCIGCSFGIYGMNGALLQDQEGNFYKITKRSSNLFRYC